MRHVPDSAGPKEATERGIEVPRVPLLHQISRKVGAAHEARICGVSTRTLQAPRNPRPLQSLCNSACALMPSRANPGQPGAKLGMVGIDMQSDDMQCVRSPCHRYLNAPNEFDAQLPGTPGGLIQAASLVMIGQCQTRNAGCDGAVHHAGGTQDSVRVGRMRVQIVLPYYRGHAPQYRMPGASRAQRLPRTGNLCKDPGPTTDECAFLPDAKMNPVLIALLMIVLPAAADPLCKASSGERRVPVIELYTSEGCDSCPPADRWVSELPARGFGPDRVVVLGFHVDYWDYLGWSDPFAQQRFSERQRAINARNGTRVVYTPQLLFNGKDYRRGLGRDDVAERISAANQRAAGATIALRLTPPATVSLGVEVGVALKSAVSPAQAQIFLALYENKLSNQVRAGENRGKHLKHDFVVRDLAGPFAAAAGRRVEFRHTFEVAASWKASELSVAAVVQDPASGEVLQALALPVCG